MRSIKTLFSAVLFAALLATTALPGCGGGEPFQSICFGGVLFGSRPDEKAKAAMEKLRELGLIWDTEPVEEYFEKCDCGCAPDFRACSVCKWTGED